MALKVTLKVQESLISATQHVGIKRQLKSLPTGPGQLLSEIWGYV